jgi:hypothetical protein
MKNYFYFVLLLILGNTNVRSQCACCASPSGFSATGSSPTTYMLKKNQLLVEAYADFRAFNGLTQTHGSEKSTLDSSFLRIHNVRTGILGVRYGITGKLALMIQQPYFSIYSNSNSSNTFGDLLSMLNLVVFSKNNHLVNLQAGLEWPTGGKAKFSNGNTIIAGSGSYDPVGGVSYSKRMVNSLFTANVFFKYSMRGFDNTRYGNALSHQLIYNYNILKNKNCSPDSVLKPSLFLGVQWFGEWAQIQFKDYVVLPNTGGYTNLIGAGLVYSYKGFSIPLFISCPVYRYLHGIQNYEQFRIRIGISKTFN